MIKMKKYDDFNKIIRDLNNIEIPPVSINAKDIIRKSVRTEKSREHKYLKEKQFSIAACVWTIIGLGIITYGANILQTNINFTRDGFIVGTEEIINIPEKDITNGQEVYQEEVTIEVGAKEQVFLDISSARDETNLPNVFPTILVDNYELTTEGIRYYHFKGGNLLQRQWKATYKNESDGEVYIYLDYAKWEGEPDTRNGAQFGYGEKISRRRSYTSSNGTKFKMAKVKEYDGTKSTMAVASIKNYYYVLIFRNISQKEVFEVLDSINLSELVNK